MPDKYRVVICAAPTPGEVETMMTNAIAYWTSKPIPWRLISNRRGPDEQIEVRRAKAGTAYDDDVDYEFAPDEDHCVILVFERRT